MERGLRGSTTVIVYPHASVRTMYVHVHIRLIVIWMAPDLAVSIAPVRHPTWDVEDIPRPERHLRHWWPELIEVDRPLLGVEGDGEGFAGEVGAENRGGGALVLPTCCSSKGFSTGFP